MTSLFQLVAGVDRRGGADELGHYLGHRARLFDTAVDKKHYLVGDIENALLVRDDNDGAVLDVAAHVLENADKVLEAPKVYSRLGLVKYAQLSLTGKQGSNLDAL